MKIMKKNNDYWGIDISKKTFDVVNVEGQHFRYSNNSQGFKEFYNTLSKNSLCVMEVTGIYHLNLACFLFKNQIDVSVVNPLKIKRFAQMHLSRNKTDKGDAHMICLFAQQQETKLWNPPSKIIEQSKDLLQIMEQYIEFRAGLKNKLDGLTAKNASLYLRQVIKDQIKNMTDSINILQERIDALMKQYNPEMLRNISSIKGLGQRTSALLIIATQGFKYFENAKQVTSYFGLAPTEYSSGSSIKGPNKISKKGNPLVRKKLYMCSLQASRHNKSCKQLYRRLLAKGKSKKLALIAVANKLLKIAFAIAKSGIPYDDDYRSRMYLV